MTVISDEQEKLLWRSFLLSMEKLMEIRKTFSSPEFTKAQWDQAVDRFEAARRDWEAKAFSGGSE